MARILNVYSTYDNKILMRGTVKQICEEFEIGGNGSSIYKHINKISREKDFYCADAPIKHDVYDIYDTDTWEYITTVLTYQQSVSEGYFKSNYTAMMNARGSMQRRAYGGYRIQKRDADEPIPNTYADRLDKRASKYITNALLK